MITLFKYRYCKFFLSPENCHLLCRQVILNLGCQSCSSEICRNSIFCLLLRVCSRSWTCLQGGLFCWKLKPCHLPRNRYIWGNCWQVRCPWMPAMSVRCIISKKYIYINKHTFFKFIFHTINIFVFWYWKIKTVLLPYKENICYKNAVFHQKKLAKKWYNCLQMVKLFHHIWEFDSSLCVEPIVITHEFGNS